MLERFTSATTFDSFKSFGKMSELKYVENSSEAELCGGVSAAYIEKKRGKKNETKKVMEEQELTKAEDMNHSVRSNRTSLLFYFLQSKYTHRYEF